MSRSITARRCAPVLAAALGALAASGAAQAQTPINDLQSTVSQVPKVASSTLCPATGGAPAPARDAACALGDLSFAWYTSWRRPGGGEVNRLTGAVANVPTAIDVDDDPLPDVIARVQLLSPSEVSVDIRRAPGEEGPLPLLAEAIVADPTDGQLPRTHINYGYDTRTGVAPKAWTSTLKLSDGGKVLAYTNEMETAGSRLTVRGGLFDGTPQNRSRVLGGELTYSSPVPSRSTATLDLRSDPKASLTSTSPTTLDLHADIDEGATKTAVDATIERLPASVGVTFTKTGADSRVITYDASSTINRIDASLVRRTNGVLTDSAIARVRDLPRRLTLTQHGSRSVTFDAHGTTVGSVTAGFGSGTMPLLRDDLPASEHYVKVFDGHFRSVAARVTGIKKVSFTGGDTTTIHTQIGHQPLVLDVTAIGASLHGRIDRVPAVMDVSVTGSAVDYRASSEISRIQLDATGLSGAFNRAHVVVVGVPRHVRVDSANGRVKADTFGDGVDSIEAEVLQSHQGRFGGLPGGNLAKATTAGGLHAFLRINDLALVEVDTAASTKVARVAFDSDHDVRPADPLQVDLTVPGAQLQARVDDLPNWIRVELPESGDLVRYSADRPIAQLDVDAALWNRAIIDATIRNIPRELKICAGAGTRCNHGAWYDSIQTFGFGFDASDDGPKPIVDAKVCLGLLSGSWTVGNCREAQQKYLLIDDLSFRDVFFEMGAGSVGNDHDNIPVYFHTSEPITIGTLVWLDRTKTGMGAGFDMRLTGRGLRANRFGALIDTSWFPTIDDHMGQLSIDCRNLEYVRIYKRDSSGRFSIGADITGLLRRFLGFTGTCS